MEAFTFNDIFATKGMEYIIVITFLVLLVPFWYLMSRPVAVQRVRRGAGVLSLSGFRIPRHILFSRGHAWAYLENSGTARVGLDDFLVNVTGDLQVVSLKPAGAMLRKGELMATIGMNGKSLRVYAPLSGEVLESNPHRAITTGDPYQKGWIYGIRPSSWREEVRHLMKADEVAGWWKKELDRLRDFLAVAAVKYSPEPSMVTYQEGGEIKANPLAGMTEGAWHDFQEAFLEV